MIFLEYIYIYIYIIFHYPIILHPPTPPLLFPGWAGPGGCFCIIFSIIFRFAASLRLSGSPGRPQTPAAAPRRPQNGPKTPQDAHKTCRRRLLLRPGARKRYKTFSFLHFFAMRHNASKTHRRRFTTAPRRLPDASKKKISRLGVVLGASWGVLGCLGASWNRSGGVLKSILDPKISVLGASFFWGRFWGHFGPCFGPFWDRFWVQVSTIFKLSGAPPTCLTKVIC